MLYKNKSVQIQIEIKTDFSSIKHDINNNFVLKLEHFVFYEAWLKKYFEIKVLFTFTDFYPNRYSLCKIIF